jgi:nucleoside-diphosphate-sugar epimerase
VINRASPKLVVLGGLGMLGHKMFQRLQERFPDTLCLIRQRSDDPIIQKVSLLTGREYRKLVAAKSSLLERKSCTSKTLHCLVEL